MNNESIVINFGASIFSRLGYGDLVEAKFSLPYNETFPLLSSRISSRKQNPHATTIKNFSNVREKKFCMIPAVIIPLEAESDREYNIKLIWVPELERWIAFKHSIWTEQSHKTDEEYEGPFELNVSCLHTLKALRKEVLNLTEHAVR